MFQLQKFYEDGKLNRDLIYLLLIGLLFTLAISLSNSFVNIYIWKMTKSFQAIGVYNLAIVILQPLTFVLAGRLAKKIDRSWILRFGVIFLALFFIVVLLVGDHASRYLVLLGSCLGVGYGFYWLAFNVLTFEITEPHTRDLFNGYLGSLTSFAGMIGPIFAGYVISVSVGEKGYTYVFAFSLILFLLAIIVSFFLSIREREGTSGLRIILKETKKNENWRLICYAHVTQGLREGVFFFVISMYVYLVTGSEFALGKFSLVSSTVSFLCYYLVTHYLKEKYRKKGILVGGLTLFFAVFLVVFHTSYWKLIVYAVVMATAYPILLVPFTSMTYDVIGRGYKAREFRVEYIVVREMFYNLGRIIGIGAFLVSVTYFNPKESLTWLLLILGTGHSWIYYFVRHIRYEENQKVQNGLEVTQSVTKTKKGNG